jgi:uracil-DNA glycosylase family 4
LGIEEVHSAIDQCLRCKAHEERLGFKLSKVTGINRGNPTARIMGIGIAPGNSAASQGLAFAGNSFTKIRSWFASAGYEMSEGDLRARLYLTSLNKCIVSPDNSTKRAILWNTCNEFLWTQIELVNPSLILLFGSEVAEKLSNRGSLQEYPAVGSALPISDLFIGELFPPVTVDARLLFMPHPSGLSRTMNDRETRSRVLAALKTELDGIRFQ